LSAVVGEGILAGLDYLEKESRLIGAEVLLAIVLSVAPAGSVLVIALGLNPVWGGFTKPGFSLSYLFRYVIRFSFDLRASCASYSFVFSVSHTVLRSATSTLANS